MMIGDGTPDDTATYIDSIESANDGLRIDNAELKVENARLREEVERVKAAWPKELAVLRNENAAFRDTNSRLREALGSLIHSNDCLARIVKQMYDCHDEDMKTLSTNTRRTATAKELLK